MGRGAINLFEVFKLPFIESGVFDDFYHILLGLFEEGSILYKHWAPLKQEWESSIQKLRSPNASAIM